MCHPTIEDRVILYNLKLWQNSFHRKNNFFFVKVNILFMKKNIFFYENNYVISAAKILFRCSLARTSYVVICVFIPFCVGKI